MKYYIVNLAVHLAVTLIFIILLIVFSNRNKKRKTKYPVSYFIPTVLAIVIVAYVYGITGPRLLDLSDVASQDYYSYTGEIDEISLFNNTLTVDGQEYYINPLRELPGVGEKVRIRYTRFSRYVISVEVVDELDVSGAIAEDSEINDVIVK
ncbi:MAG: hypothetical protein J6O00_04615 [Clostridiales bacterium]|nr:hypothetical protein [Clostridiales bacterium]